MNEQYEFPFDDDDHKRDNNDDSKRDAEYELLTDLVLLKAEIQDLLVSLESVMVAHSAEDILDDNNIFLNVKIDTDAATELYNRLSSADDLISSIMSKRNLMNYNTVMTGS